MKKNDIYAVVIVAILLFGFGTNWTFSLDSAGSIAPTTNGGDAEDGVVVTGDLSASRTLTPSAYNFDKPNTGVTTTDAQVYLTDRVKKYGANTTLEMGKAYAYYATLSGYCADVKDVPADYLSTPSVRTEHRDYDGSISETFVNSDGRTANTNINNESMGTGAVATVYLEMKPSALYTRLACNDGRVAYWLNATNRTDWNTAQFNMQTPNGVTCEKIGIVPNAISEGQVLAGFACRMDFTGADTAIYKVPITLSANSGVDVDSQAITVSYAPYDVFENTITGALETGAIKNDGSAIQALQTATVYVG